MVCAAHRCVEYRFKENVGWCVLAKNDFERGSVCATNSPIACVVLHHGISSRCSRCFSKSSALMKCSRCHYVCYCSADCQKSDWTQHKGECRYLENVLSRFRDQEAHLTDARLLLRVHSAKKTALTSSCSMNHDGIVSCGKEHVERMCVTTPASSEDAALAHFVGSLLKTSTIDLLATMLVQFRCNNFGITDELLQCVGAGVYPMGALLNHSCTPNCVLRFNLVPGQDVALQVVAVEPIAAGEELCHSYVDLVLHTSTRRHRLYSTYGFTCTCERCDGCLEVNEQYVDGKYRPEKTSNSDYIARRLKVDQELSAVLCSVLILTHCMTYNVT